MNTSNLHSLTLRWTELAGDKKASQQTRTYLDFIVDGKSLKVLLGFPESDSVTPFTKEWSEEARRENLKQYRLQKPSDLESGRIRLYVCAACGDVDCGATTFVIRDLGDRIEWSDFGNESFDEVSHKYDLPALHFDRREYFNALRVAGF